MWLRLYSILNVFLQSKLFYNSNEKICIVTFPIYQAWILRVVMTGQSYG